MEVEHCGKKLGHLGEVTLKELVEPQPLFSLCFPVTMRWAGSLSPSCCNAGTKPKKQGPPKARDTITILGDLSGALWRWHKGHLGSVRSTGSHPTGLHPQPINHKPDGLFPSKVIFQQVELCISFCVCRVVFLDTCFVWLLPCYPGRTSIPCDDVTLLFLPPKFCNL